MENASKALIIAGSVLIAMLVLSIFIWGWNRVSNYQKAKEDIDTVQQIFQKNKELESYNKQVIRGYELRSLYNLITDMNERYSQDNGFTSITARLILLRPNQGGNIEIKRGDNKLYNNSENSLVYFFEEYYIKHEDDKSYLKIFNESYFKCTEIKYDGELAGQNGKGTARVQSFKFEQILKTN